MCIPAIRHRSYPKRLKNLKFYSLRMRRFRGDPIETFNILRGRASTTIRAWQANFPPSCQLNEAIVRSKIPAVNNIFLKYKVKLNQFARKQKNDSTQ